MINLNTKESAENRELTAIELETVSGGPIYYAAVARYVSPLDMRALNPQPLPPREIIAV